MRVVGSPGAHAKRLRLRRATRGVGFTALAMLAALSFALAPSPAWRWPLAVVMAVGCVGAADAFKSASQAAVGAKSERRVGRALERSGATAVYHGRMLGAGGDADHVVVGPWVAVVETKTGSGKLSYRDGQLRAGRRNIPGDPVSQANRQAAALRRQARVASHVHAVVCVPDGTGVVRGDGWVVCGLRDLRGVLRSLPTVDEGTLGRVGSLLEKG